MVILTILFLPIHEDGVSFLYLCFFSFFQQCLIVFRVLVFYLVRFISLFLFFYFILLYFFENGTFKKRFFSFSYNLLLVNKNIRNFDILILYLQLYWIHLLVFIVFCGILGFFYIRYHVICKQWQFYYFFCNLDAFHFFFFSDCCN